MYVSKNALNNFLVHSRAKGCLRSAKNVVFLLFCILVVAPPPDLWLRYRSASRRFLYLSFINAWAENLISYKYELGKGIKIFKTYLYNTGYSFA